MESTVKTAAVGSVISMSCPDRGILVVPRSIALRPMDLDEGLLFMERKEFMLLLKILAGLIIITGFIMVLAAKSIVKKFGLDKKIKLDNETGIEPEEADDIRMLKATVNIKLYGMLVVLPGLVLTLIAFR